jgi:hypothetical protein
MYTALSMRFRSSVAELSSEGSYRQKGTIVRKKLNPRRELTEYQIVAGVQETGEPVR